MKVIYKLLLLIMLLIVAGCDIERNTYDGTLENTCKSVCIHEGLSYDWTSISGEYYYCHCEKILRFSR